MNGIIQISKIPASPPLMMQPIEPQQPYAPLPPRATSVRKHHVVIPLPRFSSIPRASSTTRGRRPQTRSYDKIDT